jgi:hypothetical protein
MELFVSTHRLLVGGTRRKESRALKEFWSSRRLEHESSVRLRGQVR